MTKTYCDHCGKELDWHEDYMDLALELKVRPYLDIDLCDACMDKLYRNVVRFCNKEDKTKD